MTEQFAIDSSVAVEMLRARTLPAEMLSGKAYLPVPVAGELFAGAFATRQPEIHLNLIEELLARCGILNLDGPSARIYGQLRARLGMGRNITPSKANDLWIAALCIQHDLPLLTNDGGFDHIAGLRVLHW